MAIISKRPPVKLFCGMIFKSEELLSNTLAKLEQRFGIVDFKSHLISFEHTSYYEKEMGGPLFKIFVSFKELIDAANISDIKIFTNEIEDGLVGVEGRQINIDPGYVTAGKVLLASAKNQQHRIYLKDGIYAEIELFYSNKKLNTLPWTYPDYTTEQYLKIFMEIRQLYGLQIKELKEKFI